MAKQKFGLGRGLDALISGASEVMAAQQSSRVDEREHFTHPNRRDHPQPPTTAQDSYRGRPQAAGIEHLYQAVWTFAAAGGHSPGY